MTGCDPYSRVAFSFWGLSISVSIEGMCDRYAISWLLLLSVTALIGGCQKNRDTVDAETHTIEVRKLESFPLARRLMLGEFQAQLKPLISIPVASPADGDIRFHVTHTRQTLSQGTLWAEVAPEQIVGEEQALTLSTLKEKQDLREEIQTVERELERVTYMRADPSLRDLPYGDRIPVSHELVEQLRHEKTLLEERLAAAGQVERLAFEQKMLGSRLTMPFDGELLVYLPVTPERTTIRVASGTPIGLMRDVSDLLLHIVIRDPQIVGIAPDLLSVQFKRDSGSVFKWSFHDTQITQTGIQDVLVYRFRLAAEDLSDQVDLIDLIGANLTCDLWVESETKVRVVPKLDVARMLTEGETFPNWTEAVQSLWPGAELVYTGRTELGLAQAEAGP